MNAISNRLPPTVIEDGESNSIPINSSISLQILADDKRPSALSELGSAAKALVSADQSISSLVVH